MYVPAKYGGRHSKQGVPLDRFTTPLSRLSPLLRKSPRYPNLPPLKHRAPDGEHARSMTNEEWLRDRQGEEWWPGWTPQGRVPGKHHPDRTQWEQTIAELKRRLFSNG